MAKSQQVLKNIFIENLKGLIDLEIDFTEKPLVAILGPNGIGKSTILHAISCINNPVAGSLNHRLSEFFTPTTHSIWTGSSFIVHQDYRDGAHVTANHRTHFRKVVGRWAPRYVTRIERYVSYIGIKTCVPIIENENQQSRIQFNTTPLTDAVSTRVRQLAGEILNKSYDEFNLHNSGATKQYIGVSTNGINYSSLSMGAGEQRIFYILSEVIKSPNYGLILIDEVDLLLHQDALIKLMEILNRVAIDKNLQIIFTTHSHAILNLNFIAVRHLYQTPNKTLCFTQTKPDALQRLTGSQLRPLEIFVEDDLASALIKKIGAEEGMSKYISIKSFGAAINCFTAVSGAILNNLSNQENMLFVLDGDEYSTDQEKNDKIGRVLTGNTPNHEQQRQIAFERISQFQLPAERRPEEYYHELICNLNDDDLNAENLEIVRAARQIVNPGDNHYYFDDIIARMDYSRPVGLNKLVDLLSLTPEWNNIKSNVRNWLNEKRELIIEN